MVTESFLVSLLSIRCQEHSWATNKVRTLSSNARSLSDTALAPAENSALFLCVLDNLEKFADAVETSMERIMAAKSFRDPVFTAAKVPSGNQVFFSLTSLLYE